LGNTTRYVYDALGRRSQVINPLGGMTRYAFDANGNVIEETNALGWTTRYTYDPLNRRVAAVDPTGEVFTYTYDAGGNLIATTDALNRTGRYQYDALNRLTVVTDALGNTLTYAYDANGNLVQFTDQNGKTRRTAYDALNRRTVVTYPNGTTLQMTYDLAGNLTAVTDPNGNTTTYTYDALNRLVSETDALGKSRTYTYDAVGNPISLKDRNGREIRLTYDALGNLIKEEWVGAGRVITYTYDAMSNLTAARDPDSFYQMSYNGMGQLTSVSNAGTPNMPDVTLNYAYDLFGNMTALSEVINGQARGVTEYTYDAFSAVTRIVQYGNGVDEKRVDLAYDAARRLTAISRYRDRAGTQLVARTAVAYDAASRPTTVEHTLGATTSRPASAGLNAATRTYNFTFDGVGRPVQRTSPDGSSTFAYDDFGQLTAATYTFQDDEAYSYDNAGNRTGSGYTVGAGNRLLSDGTYDYAYDDEGNLIRRTEKATGAVTEYTWDYRNRLTHVVFKDSSGAVTRAITYTYDVFSRRIAREVDPDGAGPQGATVERFVYDGTDILLAFDGSGNLTHRYLYGPATDWPLAEERVGGDTLWLLQESVRGNVVDVLDDNGALKNHLTYDAFGNITGQTDPAYTPRFTYAGREWDAAAGLYYYRARYYDPRVGRFIGEDPLAIQSGDYNFYRYVLNAPTQYTDPDGFGPFYYYFQKALNAVDKCVAGFADALTCGLTTKVREMVYGDTAKRNHKGTLFNIGQGLGIGASLFIPAGQILKGAKLAKLAKAIKESKRGGAVAAKMARQALTKAREFEKMAKTALQLGAKKTAQKYLRKAAIARANAKTLTQMAKNLAKTSVDDLAKVKSLERAIKTGVAFNTFQGLAGLTETGWRALANDPCDPLTWWDALILLDAVPAAHSLRALKKANQPLFVRLHKGTGFDTLEEYDRWLRAHSKEGLDQALRELDENEIRKYADKFNEAVRKGDIDKKDADEMLDLMREKSKKAPGAFWEGTAADSPEDLIERMKSQKLSRQLDSAPEPDVVDIPKLDLTPDDLGTGSMGDLKLDLPNLDLPDLGDMPDLRPPD